VYGFSVVIYAHGNNGSPEVSRPMLTRLAAAGFVVAAAFARFQQR
jgi:hypothetical protein